MTKSKPLTGSPAPASTTSGPRLDSDAAIVHGRPQYGLAKRTVRKVTFKRIKASPTLRFYNEVLGTPYQHFGLWDGDPLNLDGLRAAQLRYAAELLDWIPEGVRSILDVGCGVGTLSLEMKERGYDVEGLSPDTHQRQVFTERTGLPFHLTRFKEYEPARQFDLALMSESCQYTWIEFLFPKCVQALKPGGHVLIADYFVLAKDGTPFTRSGHHLETFLQEAERNGFELVRERDITAEVTPTLDLARGFVEGYGLPTLRIARETFQQRRPRLYRFITWALRKKIARMSESLRLMDGELFREHKRYMLYLFKLRD